MLRGITWIGFGEAAYYIAKGLFTEGYSKMRAYDSAWEDPIRGPIIQSRALSLGIELNSSLSEAIAGSEFIISLTSAKVAHSVAASVLPLLSSGQSFLDFNSASPKTKSMIEQLMRPKGVSFCDVAVMGPVPLNGHKVPLLIAGDSGKHFKAEMEPFGMQIELLDAPIGAASAVKMVRSIFMKGLPQVLLECLIAAQQYQITERLLDSLEQTLGGKSIRGIANQLFAPTAIHAKRRADEMTEVIAMLQEMGLDSSMSHATRERLLGMADLNLVSEMELEQKLSYIDILERLEQVEAII